MAQASEEEGTTTTGGLHPGDHVSWRYGVGEAIGQVVEKITEDKRIGARTFHASPEDPRYVVKSETSGKEAVRKAEALHKLTPEEEEEARHRHEAAAAAHHHQQQHHGGRSAAAAGGEEKQQHHNRSAAAAGGGPRSPPRKGGRRVASPPPSTGGHDPTYFPDPREDMMSVEQDEAALHSLPPDDKLL